jgi:hypothetical protein
MRRFFDVILKGCNADPDDSGEQHGLSGVLSRPGVAHGFVVNSIGSDHDLELREILSCSTI